MVNGKRILLNVAATYGRTLLAMAVGLFSVRWVLQALGQVDYGLNGLVGACLFFVGYFNTIVSGAVSRYYAFAIGAEEAHRSQPDSVSDWFNTALFIHLCLASVLGLVGGFLGEYAVSHWLTIPPERIGTCLWVWRLSLAVVLLNCLSAPYLAMFYAKQNIAEMSLYGMVNTCCVAVVAYCLEFVKGDRLLFYICASTAYQFLILCVQIVRARVLFPECRIDCSRLISKRRIVGLTKFVGWVLYPAVGEMVRGQGTAILVNKAWGPQINASYAVANTVSGQTTSLASALQTALSPALTSEAGTGNDAAVTRFVFRIERMCTLLVLVFAVPLAAEIHTVLKLWLVTVPPYVPELCVAMLAMLVLEKLSVGHAMAIDSYGKMGPYQVIAGTAAILSLPLIWVLSRLGLGPFAIGIAFIVLAGVKLCGRLLCCKIQLRISLRVWLRTTLLPALIVSVATGIVSLGVTHVMTASFVRVCVTSACSGLMCVLVAWFVVFDASEKNLVKSFCGKVLKREMR